MSIVLLPSRTTGRERLSMRLQSFSVKEEVQGVRALSSSSAIKVSVAETHLVIIYTSLRSRFYDGKPMQNNRSLEMVRDAGM